MNEITITVPLDDYNALARAADMLDGLAKDCNRAAKLKPAAAPEPPAPVVAVSDFPPAEPVTVDAPSPPPGAQVIGIPPVTLDELDSAGQPWDGRIHASSRAKLVKTGTWKPKRGVDPALVAQVQAEHAGSVQGAVERTSAPPPPAEPVGVTFTDIMAAVSQGVAAGKFTPGDVAALVKAHGIESLPLLNQRPDLMPIVLAELQAKLA